MPFSDPFSELAGIPGLAGDAERDFRADPPLAFERPEDTAVRQVRTANHVAREVKAAERIKAEDWAQRSIPTYMDPMGGVQPVAGADGAPITNYNKSANVGYDGTGNPVSLRYGASGPPQVEDAFANLPITTDPKTGDQYQKSSALPWRWKGKDPVVADNLAQKEKEKAVVETATALGRKVSLDERQAIHAEKDFKNQWKGITSQYGLTGDEPPEEARRIIAESFNNDTDGYASKAATDKSGWFGEDYNPEALKYRAGLDARKQAAIDAYDSAVNQRTALASQRSTIQTAQALRSNLESQHEQKHDRRTFLPVQRTRPRGGCTGKDVLQRGRNSQVLTHGAWLRLPVRISQNPKTQHTRLLSHPHRSSGDLRR